MNKKTIAVVIIILAIAVSGFFIWKFQSSKMIITQENKLTDRQKELVKSVDERMVGTKNSDNKNIVINSPKSGEIVGSPFIITGQINGEGWSGFEGQAGTVQLLDADGKVLVAAILEATTDWMRLPTKFKATLEFSSSQEQNGQLIFKNENPSGISENNREVSLPVNIEKTE